MTTQKPISKSPISDAFLGWRSCLQYGSTSAAVFGSAGRFSKSQPPRRVAFSAPSSLSQRATGSLLHTGKELDAETGFSYFGARYLDHELLTSWLSVDPMADKYPSVSPYAYCAWNPVKLVDPDGRTIWLGDHNSHYKSRYDPNQKYAEGTLGYKLNKIYHNSKAGKFVISSLINTKKTTIYQIPKILQVMGIRVFLRMTNKFIWIQINMEEQRVQSPKNCFICSSTTTNRRDVP